MTDIKNTTNDESKSVVDSLPNRVTKPKTVLEAYNDLNDSKKALLKTDFLTTFEHRSFDTFYKKIKRETPVFALERKFFAERLNLPEDELFPETN